MCFYIATANGKIFFVLNILNFARGTLRSSSSILNILIGWIVEYCGDVMSYYFLLADNSGCYNIVQIILKIITHLKLTR